MSPLWAASEPSWVVDVCLNQFVLPPVVQDRDGASTASPKSPGIVVVVEDVLDVEVVVPVVVVVVRDVVVEVVSMKIVVVVVLTLVDDVVRLVLVVLTLVEVVV